MVIRNNIYSLTEYLPLLLTMVPKMVDRVGVWRYYRDLDLCI